MTTKYKTHVRGEEVCKMIDDKNIKVLQVTKDPNNMYYYYTVFYTETKQKTNLQ